VEGTPTNHDRSSNFGSDRRANATFIMLARNDDVDGAVNAIRALEDRFNYKHHYPYVFLNDVEFSHDFKKYVQVTSF
jgi:alpha 1,2-mannosyltransferase